MAARLISPKSMVWGARQVCGLRSHAGLEFYLTLSKNGIEVNFPQVCGPRSQAGLGFCLTLSENGFEVNFPQVCGPRSQAGLGFCLTLSPSSCTVIRRQEWCLSLITVHFQVIYIPRAWHYMFIQIFQKVGSYAGYGSDTIWAFPVWSEFSPCRVPRGAQDFPQH